MTTLSPPASGVTIRMYRQGLGDCFLLAFPTGQAGQAFYMLIDCGVIFGTQNPSQVMQAVATDIEAATGGDIQLLVATHEHWDHLSGFIQAGEIFQRMRIHNLWLAWTEDPSDRLAQQLRTEFQRDHQALHLAVNRACDAESVESITNLLHFGMVIVGLDYGHAGQMTLDEITGGSPYGATTITGSDGSRWPTANELQGARYQGRKIAETAQKLLR